MATVKPADVLDHYLAVAPGPQNALDLFKGEWSSKMPAPLDHLEAGNAQLFEDARITWFEQQVGGFEGKSVLELGPLEGGHTYMLEQRGAESILAVESNTRAFMKCLIAKELLGMTRARFICGDFLEFLREPGPQFDLCVASGVLYHMREPAELIALLARRCSEHVLLWTHYYDEDLIVGDPAHAHKFVAREEVEFEGFSHVLHRHEYRAAVDWGGFCGGPALYCHWMTRPDILGCLEHFGFGDLRIQFDNPQHQNGPAFAIAARRT
ncbi:hypothetical protein BH23PLA1_BH23PLA1_02340 [soil metagenome]